jgi:DNA-binding NarL/FixJ family response regulator
MGYVLKDAISDDLIHVIREVHAGRRVVSPEIQQALDESARRPSLSLRERQVLELLAEGMRNKEIAAALGISADTAGMHVKNLYTKLDVHDRTAAVATAIRRGSSASNNCGHHRRRLTFHVNIRYNGCALVTARVAGMGAR